jgi:hypothetical protein
VQAQTVMKPFRPERLVEEARRIRREHAHHRRMVDDREGIDVGLIDNARVRRAPGCHMDFGDRGRIVWPGTTNGEFGILHSVSVRRRSYLSSSASPMRSPSGPRM